MATDVHAIKVKKYSFSFYFSSQRFFVWWQCVVVVVYILGFVLFLYCFREYIVWMYDLPSRTSALRVSSSEYNRKVKTKNNKTTHYERAHNYYHKHTLNCEHIVCTVYTPKQNNWSLRLLAKSHIRYSACYYGLVGRLYTYTIWPPIRLCKGRYSSYL